MYDWKEIVQDHEKWSDFVMVVKTLGELCKPEKEEEDDNKLSIFQDFPNKLFLL